MAACIGGTCNENRRAKALFLPLVDQQNAVPGSWKMLLLLQLLLAVAVCAIYCGNYVLIINARLTAKQD